MRKLKTSDLFELSRTIKKAGLKEEIKKVCMEANTAEDVAENGYNIIYGIIEAAAEKKTEEMIYEFLAKPFEMEPKEVEELELGEFFGGLKEIAGADMWKSFFKTAAQ